MLTYGDVLLPPPTPGMVEYLSATFTLRRLLLFSRATWPGGRMPWLTWGGGQVDDLPLKLSCLHWPRDASRFATFHTVVTDDQLTAIRSAGAPAAPLPLVMTWEDANRGEVARISANMWMLPPYPIKLITSNNGLSLLTLVCDRFWWWFRPVSLAVEEGVTTWDDLYTALAAAVGVSLTPDAISADYGFPASTLAAVYDQSPLLLDAVAANVGQRIVYALDGTARGRSVLNATADIAANLALASARSLLAGGAISPTNALSGVAANVSVVFPGASPGDPPIVITNPTGGTGAGTKVYHDTAAGLLDADAEALALAITNDYAASATVAGDWKFAGIVPWEPEVQSDSVEWLYAGDGGPLSQGDISTRILPDVYNDLTDLLLHGPAAVSTKDALTVEYDDGTNVITPVFILELHTPTFLLDAPDPDSARVRINWGTDIQPVGLQNDPGTEELAARVDHIHAGLPGYQTINTNNINTVPCGPYLYYNSFDSRFYFCINGIWCYWPVTCIGSGSGICVPGVCTLCTNAPYSWGLTTLNPAASWALVNAGNCVWQQTQSIGGHTYHVQLTFASTTTFTVEEDGQLIDSYTVTQSADCCTDLTVTQSPGFGPPDCPGCLATPRSWSVPLTGFTGVYATFNLGTVTVPYIVSRGCSWRLRSGDVTVIVTVAGDRAHLSLGNTATGVSLFGTSPLLTTNCCDPVILDIGGYVGGTGPSNITITPDCVSTPTLTLTPSCCPGGTSGGSGGGGIGISVACCPSIPVPSTLHVTLFGALSASYTLDYDSISQTWRNVGPATGCGGVNVTISLSCATHQWQFTIGVATAFPDSVDCGPPVLLSFTLHLSCGDVTAVVTI